MESWTWGDISSTLATDWIFNYANSKKALWRKVVCARSKGNNDSLLSTLGNNRNSSALLRFVNLVIGASRRVRDAINLHFKILVGDGPDTQYWNDD